MKLMKLFRKKEQELSANFIKEIYKKDRFVRYTQFILGIFIIAIAYNLLVLPSGIVYGVGGIGVILNKIYNIDPSLTIMISSILLLIVSLLTLGKEDTAKTTVGSLLYPIFVKLTEWIPNYIEINTVEPLVIVLCGAVLTGLGLGLIFKAGFTTGGTDILNAIVSKYGKMSMGNAMYFTDGVIIVIGLFILGFDKFIYSIISLYIISIMTDKVVLGISQSKAFYIITEHETSVKKFLINQLSHGVTVLDGRGGYTGNNQKVIMCIIPTREYFIVKQAIHEIDKDAFFLVTDAYEVFGGE